jgi:cytosine/adenosine deaminase-related metal-dependent hydrolase
MIFDHATVVTVDADRRIVRDGAIAVSGTRIAGVGPRAEILRRFPDDPERTDLRGMVVLPGLVNTHVHQSQALIRGCADDRALVEWLIERVWPLQGNYTPEDARTSAELCLLELLRSGTTAFIETMLAGRYGFDGIVEAVASCGIRAALSRIVMDVSTYAEEEVGSMHPGMIEDGRESFADALQLHDRWNGAADGRIQVWFGPRPPGGCTSEIYREVTAAARERGMGITMHLAEVHQDVEYIRNRFGMSPVEYVASLDMVGPRVVLVHCVHLGDRDIAALAETGTHVSHNPASNAKLGSGIAPIPAMLAAGVNVGLGTDGGPSNNSYDLLSDMRLASYVHKAAGDPSVTPSEAVLEMATIAGARAMGLEDRIGSLEEGKEADFVAIDMDKPHLTPAPDPVATIVCGAKASDVHTVVIGGEAVIRNGQVLTMDEERILAEANRRAPEVYARASVPFVPRWPTALL